MFRCSFITQKMGVSLLTWIMLYIQIVQGNMNSSEIYKYCYPTELTRPDMIYKQLQPGDFEDCFKDLSTKDVHKLHITVLSSPSKMYESIHMECIHLLQNLSELWIVQDIKINRNRQGFRYDNTALAIHLREFHLHVLYDREAEKGLLRLIQNMPYLEVLDFSGLQYDVDINTIMLSLHDKPLKSLKFNDVQTFSSVAMLNVNLTTVFNTNNTKMLLCLEMCGNNILSLSGNVPEVLPNIRVLNFSRNLLYLDSITTNFIISQLVLHPTIEIINFSHQGQPHLSVQQKRSLGEFPEASNTSPSKHVQREICSNYIEQGLFYHNMTALCAGLECLSISCSVLPVNVVMSSLIDFSCNPILKIPLGKNLKELIFDNINVMPSQLNVSLQKDLKLCFMSNSFQKISFSHNAELLQFRPIIPAVSKIHFVGLETLSFVDFSFNHNNIKLPMDSLLNFKNIETLRLQGNKVNLVMLNNTSLCSVYPKLQMLDISFANLSEIPERYFRDCGSLFDLNIENNLLDASDLSGHLQDFLHMDRVSLRYNRIQYFPQDIHTLLAKNIHVKVSLDFTGNPFICDCSDDSIETIRFFQGVQNIAQLNFEAKDSYECYQTYFSGGGYQFIKTINLEDVIPLCHNGQTPLPLIVTTGISLLIAVCCCIILVWKYRFHLFTSYYRMKLWCSSTTKSAYKYDVFVAYCTEDRFWVHDVLMKTLEDKYNFRLCIHYRDFILGEDIDDEIVKHMSQSRSHIVVISVNSVKKMWPIFELRRAYTEHIEKKKDFIVIKFGDITSQTLPGLVQQILDAKVYLEWPEAKDEGRDKHLRMRQELFWAKLSSRLYGRTYPCYLQNWCCKAQIRGGNMNYLLDDTFELLED